MTDATKYTSKLQGKHVLIIGGSSGIGFGVAEASLEHGANVIISSSQQKRVDDAVSRLKKSYPSAESRISGHAYSMGDQSTLEDNIVALLDKSTSSGKLDHMIYTAGDALAVRPLSEVTMDSLVNAGTIRFYAPVMLAKHAPKYLNPGPASSIILTTGAVSEKPIPNWSAIGSFATALHGLNRGLALDLKPIRCNLISPGAVDTELWNSMPQDKREEMFKGMEAKAATGRVGRVEDVAEAYLYLMKDQNITGSLISTNSGSLIM